MKELAYENFGKSKAEFLKSSKKLNPEIYFDKPSDYRARRRIIVFQYS